MSAADGDKVCAFPLLDDTGSGLCMRDPGMSLRQYAAIKLKVPDSGIDWLDAMIIESQRDDIAAKALSGSLAGVPGNHLIPKNAAREAYDYADAVLAARKAGA